LKTLWKIDLNIK